MASNLECLQKTWNFYTALAICEVIAKDFILPVLAILFATTTTAKAAYYRDLHLCLPFLSWLNPALPPGSLRAARTEAGPQSLQIRQLPEARNALPTAECEGNQFIFPIHFILHFLQ